MTIRGNWSRAFLAFADGIDEAIDECMRTEANKKLQELVSATPVDKGTLLGNWYAKINKPPVGFNNRRRGGGRSLRDGIAEIAKFKAPATEIHLGNTTFYGPAVKAKDSELDKALDF